MSAYSSKIYFNISYETPKLNGFDVTSNLQAYMSTIFLLIIVRKWQTDALQWYIFSTKFCDVTVSKFEIDTNEVEEATNDLINILSYLRRKVG
jgi:hypothetical protein